MYVADSQQNLIWHVICVLDIFFVLANPTYNLPELGVSQLFPILVDLCAAYNLHQDTRKVYLSNKNRFIHPTNNDICTTQRGYMIDH